MSEHDPIGDYIRDLEQTVDRLKAQLRALRKRNRKLRASSAGGQQQDTVSVLSAHVQRGQQDASTPTLAKQVGESGSTPAGEPLGQWVRVGSAETSANCATGVASIA